MLAPDADRTHQMARFSGIRSARACPMAVEIVPAMSQNSTKKGMAVSESTSDGRSRSMNGTARMVATAGRGQHIAVAASQSGIASIRLAGECSSGNRTRGEGRRDGDMNETR
jgi:hypothetical protein